MDNVKLAIEVSLVIGAVNSFETSGNVEKVGRESFYMYCGTV